jgi:hypothetical protein
VTEPAPEEPPIEGPPDESTPPPPEAEEPEQPPAEEEPAPPPACPPYPHDASITCDLPPGHNPRMIHRHSGGPDEPYYEWE